MKLILSRKASTVVVPEASVINTLNSGFGNTFKVMPDNEVDNYIQIQALRGMVCFEFDHTGTYQIQTTIIKSEAA